MSGSSFYLWDFKLFFHIYFPSFQSLDGFGLDYNSRKSVGANIGDDTGDEDNGFSSDDDTHDVPVETNIDDNNSVFFPWMMILVIVVVPVGTNIDDNDRVFSMDDDTLDSGCSCWS